MITSNDPDYINTKLIRQGKAEMHPVMDLLAEWVGQTYGARPLNIELYQPFEDQVFLQVIFQYPNGCKSISDIWPNGSCAGVEKYDAMAITAKLKEILESVREELDFPKIVVRIVGSGKVKIRYFQRNDILKIGSVICNNFFTVALNDVCDSIANRELESLVERIGHPSLWKILRFGRRVVFMVHTEEQKRRVIKKDKVAVWTRDFIELARHYDEFGYLTEQTLSIEIDTRERFKKEYNENMFYYFR
ncbi:hypothetical protein Pla110_05040 [Polystyrenella longa]|uniref:Uncharacterized protein n=1 Tax=Polystyrenella longa TaxID=2528007 RepID=A0A518CHT7_9PLAN|nr:hypothetical protein [Polystyrenella longa]QDU78800.1 hypothetical protein Pla110_05040 [Polystyrenella longa]